MNILKFFESGLKTDAKWILFQEPLQAHESEVLRQILRSQKRDFNTEEIKADLSADLEAAFTSLDFFSTAKVFYLHLRTPSKWDTLSQSRWERILELSDPQSNWVFVSAEDTKKLSAKAPLIVQNSHDATTPEMWLKFCRSQSSILRFTRHYLNMPISTRSHINSIAGIG